MSRFFGLVLLSLLFQFNGNAQTAKQDSLSIISILHAQEKAWNEGNLDKFMIGYWNNDSLLFIGKNGPTYSYQKTLSNYKKNYNDTASMGFFTSTILKLNRLSSKHYFVLGKWHLKRTKGNLEGYYTLLFEKKKGKWLIIADHSS
jgi:hypothetical protein